jgi:hypothetical protein
VLAREVVLVELREICAFWSEMVVDDIEHDGEAKMVCPIDESPEIIGVAICA